MTKVKISNLVEVYAELPANEVDHIRLVPQFDVEAFRQRSEPHIKVVTMFDKKIPKCHKLLEVYHHSDTLTESTMYYFDAECVWVTFG